MSESDPAAAANVVPPRLTAGSLWRAAYVERLTQTNLTAGRHAMEPTELKDMPAEQATVTDTAAVAPSLVNRTGGSISLQADMPCPTCGNGAVSLDDTAGAASPSYIYGLGRIEARFPSPAVEKEFTQATARADTKG